MCAEGNKHIAKKLHGLSTLQTGAGFKACFIPTKKKLHHAELHAELGVYVLLLLPPQHTHRVSQDPPPSGRQGAVKVSPSKKEAKNYCRGFDRTRKWLDCSASEYFNVLPSEGTDEICPTEPPAGTRDRPDERLSLSST